MLKSAPERVRVTPVHWLARSLMAVLWAAGSAYLVAHALAQPHPSWIEIVVSPIVWAAVIAAPIVAHHAFRQSDLLAAGLLVLASVIGSAWTLSGTISRQSEGLDERRGETVQVEQQRRDLTQKLGEAQEILAKHRKSQAAECGSGVGKRCDGMTYTMQTWAAAVDGYEARLKALPSPRTPDAGPKRIAALLSLLPGVTKPVAQLESDVQLIAPTLLGVFIELAALAFGVFGFRQMPTGAAPVPSVLPAPPAAPVEILEPVTAAQAEPLDEPDSPNMPPSTPRRKFTKTRAELHVVTLRRPASQDALARRWGVTEAAVSQWVSDWEHRGVVTRERNGRCKMVRPATRRLKIVRAA